MAYSLREQMLFRIDDDNLSIRAEQIRTRLRTYPLMIAARIAVVLLLLGLMWDKIAHPVLLMWSGVLFLLHIMESLYLWRYWYDTLTLEECKAWRNRLLLLVTLVGGMWGMGGVLLFVPNDLAYQAMLMCVILGVAAGAVTTNPVFPPALYIFVTLLIVPVFLANVMVGDTAHLILAALLMFYLLYVLNAGRELAYTFELSLRRALENEQLVYRLTVENRRAELAQQQAEQANISKSKFLAAASHDLRQPMHALTMFVEALKPHVQGEQGTVLMAQVETSVDVLGGMFDALLDISRLDAGVVSPRNELFTAQQLFDRMAAEFSWTAREKGLTLSVRACEESLHSDAMLLERILRNLIANAIRYTERGEVTVSCRAEADTLRIEVRDSGIGIAEEHLPLIFDEYYQIGNSQRDRNNGLGLGLAIVQRLASLLDCKVEVSSTPGVGSCFSLLVPLQPAGAMIPPVSHV